MDSHVKETRGARAAIAEEVQQIASVLMELLERSACLPTHARTPVRVACEGVSRRLGETRLTLALVGDSGAGRRTLINALLGERVLPTNTPRRGSTTTIVRRAPALGFSARSLDGRSVAQLSRKMPDRQALFDTSMAQIDRETSTREQLAERVRAARQRAVAPQAAAAPFWQVVWSWILRLLLGFRWLKRLPGQGTSGSETEAGARRARRATHVEQREEERVTIADLERQLAGMRSAEEIAAQAQQLRREHEKYEGERRATFLSQVRTFDGTDIGERIVEYPAKYLPEGLTLVDLPCPPVAGAPVVEQIRNRVAREIDALVVVMEVRQPLGERTASLIRELADVVPVALLVLTKADGLPKVVADGTNDVPSKVEHMRRDAFDRVASALGPNASRTPCIAVAAEASLEVRQGPSPLADHFRATIGVLSSRLDGERPILLAWREALRLRIAVGELSRAQAREEQSCRTRLSMLESKRIPDPAEFRGRLLNRVDGGVDKGADDVLAAATQGLHAAIEGLRTEWNGRISSCRTRGDVDACVAAITESAAGRIAEALEQTAELVARELHDVTEALETWAIEEIHNHYRLVRRLGAEALAPVASELTREDLETELLAVQPFEGALDAFEKERVGYGLGGVAAGALLGTLIAPGVGTAIGAVLGVLAGLLKGVDSLKQDCVAKIDACLNDTESHARAQLQTKRADLSRIIRVTLDEALEGALERLNDAIARLMAIERRAVDRERAKLEELTATRHALEECDIRLTKLVDRALVPR